MHEMSGHVAAMDYMAEHRGESVFNLGTGRGVSVLELVHAFESANSVSVPYRIAGRRAGDLAECWCSPEKSEKELGFKCELGIEDMCRDTWRWQTLNPDGYRGEK